MAGVIATAAFLLYWVFATWALANRVEDMTIPEALTTALLNLGLSIVVFAATFKVLARVGVPI